MPVAFNHEPSHSGAPGEIFGMDIAVTNLTRAWLKYMGEGEAIGISSTEAGLASFRELALAASIPPKRIGGFLSWNPARFSGFNCLFRPDPNLLEFAWKRLQPKVRPYALCGLVHTSSGERITQVFSDYLTAPTANCDALICPSSAIRNTIASIWNANADYFAHRFQMAKTPQCPVELHTLPLGIDTAHFAAIASAENRKTQRDHLALGDEEILILFVGRLSFVTKAHPLPLLLAAERAAIASRKKVRLVLSGYFKPKEMEDFFKLLVDDCCKNAKVNFIANDDPRFPDGLWAAADIFCSLVDNVQESFGLTPIEAMAAGIPAVVSDWDGYRVGIRHGEDGYRIPTIAPPSGCGAEMAYQAFNGVDSYGYHLGCAAQSTAVDIETAAAALQLLIERPDLRRKLGANGRERAVKNFDWSVIIPAYRALWEELGAKAQEALAKGLAPAHWPMAHRAYPDPYAIFSDFPTHRLSMDDRLMLMASAGEMERLAQHKMNRFALHLLLPHEIIFGWVAALAQGTPLKIAELAEKFPGHGKESQLRTAGWLMKLGICRLAEPLAPRNG